MSGISELRGYKDEILKAEVGALLFNLGKTHIGFWHEKDGVNYWKLHFGITDEAKFKNDFKNKFGYSPFGKYKNYHTDHSDISKTPFEYETEKYKIKDFIFNQKVTFPFLDSNSQLDWIEFFKGDLSDKDFIEKIFFRGCENINSGIDKGAPKKQLIGLWLANAFGSYKRKVEIQDLDDERAKFYNKLYYFLLNNNYLTTPDWNKIREFVVKEIKNWYSRLLSDSRFPVNDVTLWDQAFMTATMFKATLANMVINSSKYNEYFNNPSSIKWRILGIQYDKLGLAEKGYKPQQIQWYRETSHDIDEEVKRLIEYEYPIGNEIYRDETGIYFLVGEDIGEGSGKKSEDKSNENVKDESNLVKLRDDLEEIKEKILEIFKEKSHDEFYPAIFLTKASRGLMNLTFLLEKAKENFLKADWSKKDTSLCLEKSNSGRAIGICQVCKQRLVYKNDRPLEDKRICDFCYEEKTKGRINKWLQNRSGETIWMDELKDDNGRIALVTLKFELRDWLNGNMLNSLVLQEKVYWQSVKESLAEDLKEIFKNNTDKKVSDTVLKEFTDKALYSLNIKKYSIIENILLERSIGDRWEEFVYKQLSDWDDQNKKPLNQKIDFNNRKIFWNNLTDPDIDFLSELILQFLLRKNPSPARLRRVWESTKEFFEEIEKNICDYAMIPKERRKRYFWENVKDKNGNSIEDGEYFDGDTIFWAKDGKVYMITYVKEENLKQTYNLKEYETKEDTGISLDLSSRKEETYLPYMSILDPTPVSWQFIIPAQYVPSLVFKFREKYDEYFRFVYGKLPLHIGVVIQDYKKPLYVGIDALRKIRRDVKDLDKLYIEKEASEIRKKLQCQKTEEHLNNTQAYYSLYWNKNITNGYKFYIKPDAKHQKWIAPINNTDMIQVIPNTFDFEFLDTNLRRNDIYYDEKKNYKRAFGYKQLRPFDLDRYWEKFKEFKKLTEKVNPTKLQKLINVIFEKTASLDSEDTNKDGVSKFLATAFVNVLELNSSNNSESKEALKKIFDIRDDDFYNSLGEKLKNEENIYLFIDMFEFWHKALKEV